MMRTLTAAVFAGAMATTAGAATLDFVAEAAGNERGVANGTTIVFDGLGVTFGATEAGNEAFAYFDDLNASGNPAGLGVCTALNGPAPADCLRSGDDNLRATEELTLSFDRTVTLTGFSFYDKVHAVLPRSGTEELMWAVNGGAFQTLTFADALTATVANVSTITFGHAGTDYYIGSIAAVPLPAGVLLLSTALGGLGLARRKKTSA